MTRSVLSEPSGIVSPSSQFGTAVCNPEGQAHLAEAFECFGMCDEAHVIPAGVYLEE
jgi:hypothetical protein